MSSDPFVEAAAPHSSHDNQAAKTSLDSDYVLEAAKAFKDWSNYLLITTVAATGWVAEQKIGLDPCFVRICVFLFAGSAISGILTLAVLPSIIQQIPIASGKSFYDIESEFHPLLGTPAWSKKVRVKQVCWYQHVLFILGILVYVIAVARSNPPATPPTPQGNTTPNGVQTSTRP